MRSSWGMRAFLVVAAVTAVLVPSAASANHSWGGYHWARTANPFTLQLGDNVSSAWDAHLGAASGDWSGSTVLDTVVVAGSASPRTCKPKAGRVQVCNATYGNNGWLGVAQIWLSGSHISQGSVKLNDTYFNTATYNTSAWRQMVMCQEVGHTFGLNHQDENFTNANLGTCMDYTNNPSSNQHPNQHDYDQLVTIYSHLDSTTTVGATAVSPSARAVGDTPGEWGRMVAGSDDPHAVAVFERDLGADQKVVTFVIWAE